MSASASEVSACTSTISPLYGLGSSFDDRSLPIEYARSPQAEEAEQALNRKAECAAALPGLLTQSSTTCKVCLQFLEALWEDEKRDRD
jgi:hypothetical protein